MSYTFLNLQDKSLARVDETIDDADQEVLKVIKDAINNAYMLVASTIDKRTTIFVKSLEDYNNKIPIPSDFVEILLAEHEILGPIDTMDYEKLGDFIYFRNKDITSGEVTITYSKYPTPLVNDSDVIAIKDAFIGPITAFAAYTYQLYKKKYAAAQLLLQEFNAYIPSSAAQIPQNTDQVQ